MNVFKMSKKEREICKFGMDFKKSFLLLFLSNISNADISYGFEK